MKKLFICLLAVAALYSCKVVDPYVKNPTSVEYMTEFCSRIFEDNVSSYLRYFYNAYYIAKFEAGDAELKVSKEYDMIRTGLQLKDGVYTYDYHKYNYKGEDFFAPKGICVVQMGYKNELTVLREDENRWLIGSGEGIALDVTVLEVTENGLLLKVTVDGVITEESTYSALVMADTLQTEFRHKRIGEDRSEVYDGTVTIVFYNNETLLKTVDMTFCQSGPTWNII